MCVCRYFSCVVSQTWACAARGQRGDEVKVDAEVKVKGPKVVTMETEVAGVGAPHRRSWTMMTRCYKASVGKEHAFLEPPGHCRRQPLCWHWLLMDRQTMVCWWTRPLAWMIVWRAKNVAQHFCRQLWPQRPPVHQRSQTPDRIAPEDHDVTGKRMCCCHLCMKSVCFAGLKALKYGLKNNGKD